ncbi:hypothetical protein BH20GEM2_BH20GEM2_15410 [soil metagenome]
MFLAFHPAPLGPVSTLVISLPPHDPSQNHRSARPASGRSNALRLWRHRLRKLSGLRGSELARLCQAQGVLIWAQLLVWTRPQGKLVTTKWPAQPEDPPSPAERERALELALAIERAAGHGIFRPACLVRAVALNRMLVSRGIRGSRIKVGVRWAADGFAAHAWVEHCDRVIGDRESHVREFEQLTSIDLAGR